MIKVTANSGFRMMPEGENNVVCTEVTLLPAKNPALIEMIFRNDDGATVKTKFDLDKEKALIALGKWIYIAMDKQNDGQDVDESQIPALFLNEKFKIIVKHNEYNGKTYANVVAVVEHYPSEDDFDL